MQSQDWFEYIRSLVHEQQALRLRLEEADSQTAPKCQQYGSVGHGSGGGDASAPILKALEVREAYERKQLVLERLLEVGYSVLYGPDGMAGLAEGLDMAAADCICGHYLLGMTWREVADEMVRPESTDGPQWCKRKAYRAFAWMDAQR